MKKLFLSAVVFAFSFLFLTAVAQDTNEWTKKKQKNGLRKWNGWEG